MSNTIILPTHKVRVDRGRAQISVEVADHEIAVLKAVHGEGAVNIREANIGDRDYAASAEVEYGRLKRVYDNRNDQPVGRVFPTFYDLGRFGFDVRATSPADDVNSSGAVNIERRPARRIGVEAEAAQTDAPAFSRDANGPADAAPLGEAETKPDDASSDGAPEKPTKPAKAK